MSVGDFLKEAGIKAPVMLDGSCSIKDATEKSAGELALVTTE